MKKPTRRDIAVASVAIGAVAAAGAQAQTPLAVDNASMGDVIQALAEGKTTATTLARAYLARIEAYDRGGLALNSVRELNPEALAIAGRLEHIKPSAKQPLAGVPILVKDNIATGDKQHTTAGSLALETARARDDATVVKRLRAAGAVILGKANLTEFANILAIGMPSGYSSLGGQVKNPYSPDLMVDEIVPLVQPGGSSAGSAVAVAAGLCAAAIGTETSGSLLSPATQNGLVTVKPTVGLISRSGILPISHSQDTAGPLTRTVRDAAMMMNVMARPDSRDLYGRPDDIEDYLKGFDKGVKNLRIAYSPGLGFVERDRIDRDVAVAVEHAAKVFKTLGAKVVEDSPDLQGLDPRRILNAHWQSNVAVVVKGFSPEKRALMDPGLLKAAEHGANLGQEAVVTAIHQRQQLGVIMNQFMAKYDLLLTPTMPMTAFAVNENAAWGGDGVDIGWTPFTLTFNLTRQPAATIPCGLDREGLPIGLQIVGGHARDALVLRAAAAYERVRPIPAPPMAHQI